MLLYISWQCILEKKCASLTTCRCCVENLHFLCSVERIKLFVNVHLHCIVALSAMFTLKCANTQDHHNCCEVKSHSHALATFQSNGTARNQEAIRMKCVFCSYFEKIVYVDNYIDYIIHKVCNSLKTPLTQL